MANEQLEQFLASESASAAEPAPPAAPEPPPEAAAPKPEAKAEPASRTPAAKPEAEDDADPDPADRIERDGKSYIPQPVLERERQRRQDWKEKAARLEGELAAMRRQQEDAQRRAAAPPPQPQQPPPDPATNPQGWAQHVVQQQQAALLNERLNNSEMMLRDKIGDDKLNEYVGEFRSMAEADPTLFGKLYSQPHPYAWMTREVDRLRLVRDVGDDPAAFRAKIEAEARAKWDAEAATRPPPVSPAAGLQPSLATARSVAGRTAAAWTGEPSLEDVLAPVQNRKRPNGAGGSVRY